MHVNDEGFMLIKRWEGLRLKAYKDVGGILTIGYGHTSAAGKPAVYEGMVITEEEADQILWNDLQIFEQAVNKNVRVPLNPNQFSALVSFVYNVGEGAFRKSTLLKKLNNGEYDAVPAELAKWNKVGKKTVPGLVNRRAAEAGLWAKDSYVSSNSQPVTPPKDLGPVKDVIKAGGGLITGGALSYAPGLLTPPAVYFLGVALLVVVGLGGFYFYKKYIQ